MLRGESNKSVLNHWLDEFVGRRIVGMPTCLDPDLCPSKLRILNLYRLIQQLHWVSGCQEMASLTKKNSKHPWLTAFKWSKMVDDLCVPGWELPLSRWWFQIFFIFTPTWGRFPIWLIFFRWVETTSQLCLSSFLITPPPPPKKKKRKIGKQHLKRGQFCFFVPFSGIVKWPNSKVLERWPRTIGVKVGLRRLNHLGRLHFSTWMSQEAKIKG